MTTPITGQGLNVCIPPDDELSLTSKKAAQNKVITEELTDLSNAISQKQDAPSTAGTAGQVLGLDSNLNPAWVDQTGGGSDVPYMETRMDMLTDVDQSGSLQLLDLTLYTLRNNGSKYYYQHVTIPCVTNGKYYFNPLGYGPGPNVIYVLDANGNRLAYNGTASTSLSGLSSWDVIERVDDTHLIKYTYSYESNFKNNSPRSIEYYTFDTAVASLFFDIYWSVDMSEKSKDIGVTINRPTAVYIPYGVDVNYSDELIDGVFNGFTSENLWYDIPEKRLNPWMQRSYALTDNLLDDRKIDWIGNGQFYKMKPGQKVPVIGGRTIMCTKGMASIRTYTANNVEASLPNTNPGTPIVLPQDVVAIRFDLWISNNPYDIPPGMYEPAYLYYADDTLYTYDDVDRNPVPMAQINGWDINKNVYDMAIPDVGSNIVRMMRTFAIREFNHQRDALRIGTFNIYINNTWTNRPTIKKELETYGIDICAFQEARNIDSSGNQLNIGDYLKGWQFKYCNTNEGTSGNGRALASAYEVLSSEEVAFTDNPTNSYLKCIIQLPRYKDYADGLTTLSLYTYHGNVTSGTTRAAEVTQMLTAIASDTSDFVIVTGDTNDFSANKEVWAMFQNAGLTPVHDGKSETVTERNNSIDNIFISAHCSCAYYDVINSGEWTYIPRGSSTPQPVSDHDLLYADIVFDFETVIEARN